MELKIKWNKRALNQFDEALEYIEKDSAVNAEKVKKEILLKIDGLLHLCSCLRIKKESPGSCLTNRNY